MKYELIIKEIKSGEVVCRKECDCVVGGFSGMIKPGAVAEEAVSLLNGPIYVSMSAIKAAQGTIDRLKKQISDNYKETYGENITYEELEDFVEKITATAEANEDALRAVANGEVE